MENFLAYYDEVEICAESAGAHFKAAITIRNQTMVDRPDLIMCGIERKSGGAFKAVEHARKQKKKIINFLEI